MQLWKITNPINNTVKTASTILVDKIVEELENTYNADMLVEEINPDSLKLSELVDLMDEELVELNNTMDIADRYPPITHKVLSFLLLKMFEPEKVKSIFVFLFKAGNLSYLCGNWEAELIYSNFYQLEHKNHPDDFETQFKKQVDTELYGKSGD